ncbi:PREDICTED: transmembrane protein 255A [Gekko japonicus]|uniref:Transmembrane protein 255A n=1 Tax=Gekko japonicus TaxID=146911 RepID=A0ABM1L992_GEKJA|nr:PREDICTED: transmembrane protein 255A [Gekko japonicus]
MAMATTYTTVLMGPGLRGCEARILMDPQCFCVGSPWSWAGCVLSGLRKRRRPPLAAARSTSLGQREKEREGEREGGRMCGGRRVPAQSPSPTPWLGLGSFLGIIGSNLIENKKQMLVASIVFISFGVLAAFCCAIVDGVFAARHIDLRPLYAGRCHYFSKSTAPPEAVCPLQQRGPCTPKIRTNTCFCCDLYNCGRVEISGGYYEYIDVSSCQDIIHLYHLLWSATILNIIGLFLGIITAAILAGFKDMTPSLPALNCTVENARPTVSYYSRPQVTSYNTYYHSTPHLPPYSAYDFQHSCLLPLNDPPSLSPSPSYVWSPTAPPRYSPPYFPPFEKPPPYTP